MATQQMLKLEVLNFEYQAFRENQLLTHEQLNNVIEFFEDQNRLTRTCLLGVGIVCGLNISVEDNVVKVTRGCAVTTDGDLLLMENTTYQSCRVYSNVSDGKKLPIYDPFFSPFVPGEQIELWELVLPDALNALPQASFSLSEFKNTTGKELNELAGLLYLEYYQSEADACSPINCNNQGLKQNARLKVLLLSTSDLDKVINKQSEEAINDSLFKKYHDAYEQYYAFPELHAKRLLLNNSITTSKLDTLRLAYLKIINEGSVALATAIGALGSTFGAILNKQNDISSTELSTRLLSALRSSPSIYDVQYFYDFYKDVVDCYNELRYALYDSVYVCCPDKYAFPKHVMLGLLTTDVANNQRYRHIFYPSPVVGSGKQHFQVAQSIYRRLYLMIYSFSIPKKITDIRVTPSIESRQLLEHRSIPFYYQFSGNTNEFLRNWSNSRAKRGTQKNILSYHAADYAEDPSIRDPFLYTVDQYDFYRVEGHIGKKITDVMPELLKQRTDKSLPVEIIAVSLADNVKITDIDIRDYAVQFEDLNTILNSWKSEQNCILSDASKYFSSFNLDPAKNFRPPTLKEVFGTKLPDKRFFAEAFDVDSVRFSQPIQPVAPTFTATPFAPQPGLAPLLRRGAVNLGATGIGASAFSTTSAIRATSAAAIARNTAAASFGSTLPARGNFASIGVEATILPTSLKGVGKAETINDFFTPINVKETEAVTASLNNNQGSISSVFNIGALLQQDFISAEIAILKFKDILEEKKETIANVSADDQKLILKIPFDLLSFMHQASRFEPFTLNDLSRDTMDSYKAALDKLCDKARESKDAVSKIFNGANYVKKGFEEDYLWWLSVLASNCCAADSIQILLDEIDQRKNAVLASLSFSAYAQKHPGLEHRAGVPRGGTLVLVYASIPRKVTIPTRSDLLTGAAAINVASTKATVAKQALFTGKETNVIPNKEDVASFIEQNNGAISISDTLKTFLDKKNVTEDSIEGQNTISEVLLMAKNLSEQRVLTGFAQVTDKTVIADFCLPYVCCSNVPSTTFIMAKPRFILMLAKQVACNDDDLLEFRKDPPEGKVVASQGFEETVVEKDGKAFFNPQKVKPEMFGQVASFTIDGQVTDCSIKVLRHPTASFDVTIKEETAALLTVTVTNTSDDPSGKEYTYIWKLKDGAVLSSDAVKTPKDFTFDKKQLGAVDSIAIELTAVNGVCQSETVLKEVKVTTIEKADFTLSTNEVCEDGTPVQITDIVPADGVVKASKLESAITIAADGKTIFNPAVAAQNQLLNVPISFTVNNLTVPGKTVTVYSKPQPNFTIEVISRKGSILLVGITDTTPNKTDKFQYEWSFNDSSARNESSSFKHEIDLTKIVNSNVALATLKIINGTCSNSTTVKTPIPGDVVADCNGSVTSEMRAQAKALSNINNANDIPALVDLVDRVTSQYKDVSRANENLNKPEFQLDTINQSISLLKNLITIINRNQNRTQTNDLSNQLLSMIIRLPLYTIKCSDQIDDKVKIQLQDWLNILFDNLPKVARVLPDFPRTGIIDFIKLYIKSMLLNDTEIKNQLSELVKKISTTF